MSSATVAVVIMGYLGTPMRAFAEILTVMYLGVIVLVLLHSKCSLDAAKPNQGFDLTINPNIQDD